MLLTPQLFSKMTCPKFTIELDGYRFCMVTMQKHPK